MPGKALPKTDPRNKILLWLIAERFVITMKIVRRFIPALLLILAVVLAACGGPYSGKESEVEAILRPLAEKETDLLHYLYGDGFKTMDEVSAADAEYTATAKYYRVSADAPYHSVDELKAAIREVYSKERSEEIESGLFENTGSFSRFNDYQVTGIGGEVLSTDLGIDVTQNHPPRELFAVILPGTTKVLRSTAALIECEVGYTDGRTGDALTMKIRLVYENGEWRLDDSTWAGAVA